MAPPPSAPLPAEVDDEMQDKIFNAALIGDLPRFKSLVMLLDMGRGCLREAVEALRERKKWMLKGQSALHVAAIGGRLQVCRYLVGELGVDVNLVDEQGRTPLFMTTLPNNIGCASYLLNHGANPDISCHDGISPLHQAAVAGRCDMVKLLLAKGAYVDLEAHCGTPLHVAASKDQDGAMKILLNYKADVNKRVNGKTPMTAAIEANSKKCMRLLYQAGADRKEALVYAAENLHAAKVISTDFAKQILEVADTNRLNPDDEPVAKRETRERGLKELASYAFKEKEFELAEQYYTLMILLDPEDATAFSNRSLCWLLMGDGGKALSDADDCRRRRPHWPKACYRQGAAMMLLKDYQGAFERFSDGLKLDPGNTELEDALRKASEAQKMSGCTSRE